MIEIGGNLTVVIIVALIALYNTIKVIVENRRSDD